MDDANVGHVLQSFFPSHSNTPNRPGTQKLGGILYFHRITDTRMDGGALRCLKLFEDICGPTFLQNTALITTMWDKYPEEFQAAKETERELINQYWHPCLAVRHNPDGAGVVDIFGSDDDIVKLDTDITHRSPLTGAMYARSDNTKEMFEDILRKIIQKKPVIPELQKELWREDILDNTAAGRGLREGKINEADKWEVNPVVGGKVPLAVSAEGGVELANGVEIDKAGDEVVGEVAPAKITPDTQLYPHKPARTSENFTVSLFDHEHIPYLPRC